MKQQHIEELLTDGDRLLELANEEIGRPEEDTVSIAVCGGAQESLKRYFSYFLHKNNIPHDIDQSIDQLHRQCIAVDPRFKTIDFEAMGCRSLNANDNEQYCLDANHAGSCVHIANQVRQLIN